MSINERFSFPASGSDIVKLYDLTTLCEETEDKYQNPFTMPVAILLYKWVFTIFVAVLSSWCSCIQNTDQNSWSNDNHKLAKSQFH